MAAAANRVVLCEGQTGVSQGSETGKLDTLGKTVVIIPEASLLRLQPGIT